MNNKVTRFIISHGTNAGFGFGNELAEVVSETMTQQWIKSYISSITSYASNERYLAKGISSVSYFTKDGYVVVMRSKVKEDEGLHLESEVNVINSRLKRICYSSFAQEHGNAPGDKAFRDGLRLAVLTALLGEDTKLYCIADDTDAAVNVFRSTVYGFNEKIMDKSALVEAVSDVPAVFSPVFLCRCIEPSDYDTFCKRAAADNNSIIVDFKGTKQIKYNLSAPTFAQRFLIKLTEKYGFDGVYAALENAIASSAIHDAPTRRGLFNAWAYLCIKNRFRNDGSSLSMTAEEKEELKELFK